MSTKLSTRTATWARLAVSCALVLSFVPAAGAQDAALLSVLRDLPDRIPFPDDLVQSRSAIVERSEKIDPLLLSLLDGVAARGLSSLSASAGAMQVSVRDDLVAVELIAEDEIGREELELRVEDEGGEVTATLDNVVLARLPVDRIESFEEEAELYYMTAQSRFSHSPPDAGGPRAEAGCRGRGWRPACGRSGRNGSTPRASRGAG